MLTKQSKENYEKGCRMSQTDETLRNRERRLSELLIRIQKLLLYMKCLYNVEGQMVSFPAIFNIRKRI